MKLFHTTSLSAVRGLLMCCRKQAAAVLLLTIACGPAPAQNRYQDQWNIRGTVEEDAARHESALDPNSENERIVSDDLNRIPPASKSPLWFAPAGHTLPPYSAESGSYHDTLVPDPDRDAGMFRAVPRQISGQELVIPGGSGEPGEPADPLDPAGNPYSDPYSGTMMPDGYGTSGYATLPSGTLIPEVVFSESPACNSCDEWQMLPSGLLYHSYLAGPREPRMQFVPLRDLKNNETYWDAVLGGRVGIIRKGSRGAVDPRGFQLDLEGAVYARVLPDQPSAALAASDYRAGILGTWKENRTAWKVGYYHVSAHLGDEFMLLNPGFTRINYVRDSLIAGTVYDLTMNSRVYGEIALAAGSQGGAEPLELQFGAEHTPLAALSPRGAPYAAINGHYRQEFDSTVGMNVVAGWNWLGPESRHRLRIGLQYYNGPSLTYALFDRHESLLGGGIWFDY